MKAILSRRYDVKQTFGCLYVFDEDRAVAYVKTLELPYLENKPEISCILPGEYECETITHEDFGICFLVKGVPGRSGILIHIFNFATGNNVETRGCIAPGLRYFDVNHDGNLDIAESTKAMNVLRAVLPKKFQLIIL